MTAIGSGLELTQKTQLILSPRLQHSLRLLQAPGPELARLLREALLGNPLLEEEVPEDPGADARMRRAEEYRAPWGREDRGARFEPPQAAAVCWRADLLRQVRLDPQGCADAEIAEYILGCLDERGYLGVPVKEMARSLRQPVVRVARVRALIMKLDPPGLGARNLEECLIAQLEVRNAGQSLAAQIVRGHLSDLARRRWGFIAERLRTTPESVRAAADEIRTLWPRPRRLVERDGAGTIYPDLSIQWVAGNLEVRLHERLLPRLRLATLGAHLTADPRARAFLADRMVHARWLIGGLAARRRTLVRLTEIVCEHQRPFFEHGIRHLKPLAYRQMADMMALHESTVARAVRGKYVQTPRGLFPLRFFFAKGLPHADGGERAPASLKARMRELIAAEPDMRPLTDREIAGILRRDGHRISRRTVAKYRDQMRIPRASFRGRP